MPASDPMAPTHVPPDLLCPTCCPLQEYIFSHKAGALASFAAATEYAFATVVQRDMAHGNVSVLCLVSSGSLRMFYHHVLSSHFNVVMINIMNRVWPCLAA